MQRFCSSSPAQQCPPPCPALIPVDTFDTKQLVLAPGSENNKRYRPGKRRLWTATAAPPTYTSRPSTQPQQAQSNRALVVYAWWGRVWPQFTADAATGWNSCLQAHDHPSPSTTIQKVCCMVQLELCVVGAGVEAYSTSCREVSTIMNRSCSAIERALPNLSPQMIYYHSIKYDRCC